MNENLILAVPVFYPFAGALLAGIVGRKKEAARTYLANFIVVSEFLLVFALWTENGGESGAAAFYRCYLPGHQHLVSRPIGIGDDAGHVPDALRIPDGTAAKFLYN